MGKEYYTAKDLAKLITFIENKKKPFGERSARELLSGYPTENKNKLEEGDPKFLKCRKPLYYSEETIRKVLIERKMGRSVSIQDLNETVNDLYLIEKEQERAGKAEDEQTELEGISGVLYGLIKKREDLIKKKGNKIEIHKLKEEIDKIQKQYNIYIEGTNYHYDDPYSYENMVDTYKIGREAKEKKLEIILEVLLEEMGYIFEEKEYYSDLVDIATANAYLDDTEMFPIHILKKKDKVKNPKKYYIKNILQGKGKS